MSAGIRLLIGLGILLGFINLAPLQVLVCFVIGEKKVGSEFPMLYPSGLYRKVKMNFLGVGIVYLIYMALCPIPFLMTVFYWLTHVGRKK